jgi:uncharacterized protein (DUF342 family)
MYAYLSVRVREPLPEPINEQEIYTRLTSLGITQGIDISAIRKTLKAGEQGISHKDVCIAQGVPAKTERTGYYIFAPKLRALDNIFRTGTPRPEKSKPEVSPTVSDTKLPPHNEPDKPPGPSTDYSEPVSVQNRVDYRDIRSYLVVTENEILALWKPASPGVVGYDLSGNEVPYSKEVVHSLEPGDGTRKDDDGRVYSAVTGKLSWDAKRFFVETTIRIHGNIDYRVGNIRFPGNLILEGEIRDRFKVWIGGSLDCTHGLDVHQVMTGGPVRVKEGIIGHGRGLLRTKNTVNARHVENCTIEALGDVSLEKASYNSRVFSRGSVLLPKGRIVGGQIKTRDNIQVGVLGNVAESPTEVVLGIDFVVERMVDHYNNRQHTILQERRELARAGQKGSIPQTTTEERFNRLLEEEEYNNEQLVRLLPLLDVNDKAVLEVVDMIHPGVSIRICSLQYFPSKPLKGVRFFIDKPNGVIKYEKLARS